MAVEILQKANLEGIVSVRPYWYQKFDHSILSIRGEYICVQSTNNFSSTEVKNKRWVKQKCKK